MNSLYLDFENLKVFQKSVLPNYLHDSVYLMLNALHSGTFCVIVILDVKNQIFI